MQVICPKCSTEYVLDATKIPTQGALLPCATCGEKFPISPTPEETAAPIEENPAPVDNPFDDLNLNIEAQEESANASDFANDAPAFLDNIPLSDTNPPEENEFETELTTDDFTTLDLSFEPLQIADDVDNTKSEDDISAGEMDSVPDMDAMGFDFADLELADEMASNPAEPTSDTGPSQSSASEIQETPLADDPFAALDLGNTPEAAPTAEAPGDDPFAALDLGNTPEAVPTAEATEDDPFAALDLGNTPEEAPTAEATEDDPFAALDLEDTPEETPTAETPGDDPFAALDLGDTPEQSSAPLDKELDPFAGYEKETEPESSFEAAQEDDFADLDMNFADDAFTEKPKEESAEETTQNESDPFGDLDFNADNAMTSDADTSTEPEETADTTSEPDGDETDAERRPTLTSLPNVFDDEESEAVDMDAIDSDGDTVDASASPPSQEPPQEPPQEPLQDEHAAGETLDENAQTPGPVDDLPTVFEDEHDYAGERINTGHIETGVNAALAEAFGDDADLDAIESLEPSTRYSPKALLENYNSRPKKIQAAIASSALLVLGALGYLVFTLVQSEAPTEIAQVAPKQSQEIKTEVPKETEAEEPKIQEPELPVLTQESVYYLGYNALEQRARQLFESSVAKNSKPTPLLLWAWLRLSQVYRLKSARKQLLKALSRGPRIPNKDMAAALNFTYLSLTGKANKAMLKAKLRLKKNKIENSPHVAFVLAQIYQQKKKKDAALKLLLPFSEKAKPWLDVQIQSIELLAKNGSANNERIQSVVSKLLEVNPSADTLARLARFALTNKKYQLAETTLSKLDIKKEYLSIPEIHRENAFQDVLYYQIRQGMLIKALETAKLWTETIPESLNAAIQTSRLLTQMKKGQSFLSDLLANAKSRQEKSILLAEEIR
ncbi:MAG: zinc-ribbon domain-containing protein, partial [Myxococcota bacterium]|nr:zinc-ribbon domain-containing protein [Myxococcota bacterium]